MRAHNRGDGGIMALTALIQRKRIGRTALLVTLGIFGAALFFGDGMITPAISVTSAIGGLSVVSPEPVHSWSFPCRWPSSSSCSPVSASGPAPWAGCSVR